MNFQGNNTSLGQPSMYYYPQNYFYIPPNYYLYSMPVMNFPNNHQHHYESNNIEKSNQEPTFSSSQVKQEQILQQKMKNDFANVSQIIQDRQHQIPKQNAFHVRNVFKYFDPCQAPLVTSTLSRSSIPLLQYQKIHRNVSTIQGIQKENGYLVNPLAQSFQENDPLIEPDANEYPFIISKSLIKKRMVKARSHNGFIQRKSKIHRVKVKNAKNTKKLISKIALLSESIQKVDSQQQSEIIHIQSSSNQKAQSKHSNKIDQPAAKSNTTILSSKKLLSHKLLTQRREKMRNNDSRLFQVPQAQKNRSCNQSQKDKK